MVPPAEFSSDGRIAEVGELSEDVHADLPGGDERTAAVGPAQLLYGEAEGLRGGIEDDLGGDPTGLVSRDDVGKDLFGQFTVHRLAVEAGEGGHPDKSTFQLADVVLHVGGDELQYLVWDGHLFMFGLGLEDGQACLELGGLDLGDQPGQEPATQPVP